MDAPTLLRAVIAALGVLVLTWAVLAVLAARLPDGAVKDIARFLPDCVTTLRRLRGHPDVPRRAKVAVALAAVWVLSPIDLIPEFLPVIGPLDDALVVALCLRYAARRVPMAVLAEAWPGRPEPLRRLVGPRSAGGSRLG